MPSDVWVHSIHTQASKYCMHACSLVVGEQTFSLQINKYSKHQAVLEKEKTVTKWISSYTLCEKKQKLDGYK